MTNVIQELVLTSNKYPKLMISNTTKFIYLMDKPRKGTRLVSEHKVYRVGSYLTALDMDVLSDYNEPVTLINSKE